MASSQLCPAGACVIERRDRSGMEASVDAGRSRAVVGRRAHQPASVGLGEAGRMVGRLALGREAAGPAAPRSGALRSPVAAEHRHDGSPHPDRAGGRSRAVRRDAHRVGVANAAAQGLLIHPDHDHIQTSARFGTVRRLSQPTSTMAVRQLHDAAGRATFRQRSIDK